MLVSANNNNTIGYFYIYNITIVLSIRFGGKVIINRTSI